MYCDLILSYFYKLLVWIYLVEVYIGIIIYILEMKFIGFLIIKFWKKYIILFVFCDYNFFLLFKVCEKKICFMNKLCIVFVDFDSCEYIIYKDFIKLCFY